MDQAQLALLGHSLLIPELGTAHRAEHYIFSTLTQLSEALGGRHCHAPTLPWRKLGRLRTTQLLRNMVDRQGTWRADASFPQ